MAFYKVLKTGHFSEEKFNQVGSVIEIDENAAKIAEERGYLKKTTRKPKPIKVKIEVKPKKVKNAKNAVANVVPKQMKPPLKNLAVANAVERKLRQMQVQKRQQILLKSKSPIYTSYIGNNLI